MIPPDKSKVQPTSSNHAGKDELQNNLIALSTRFREAFIRISMASLRRLQSLSTKWRRKRANHAPRVLAAAPIPVMQHTPQVAPQLPAPHIPEPAPQPPSPGEPPCAPQLFTEPPESEASHVPPDNLFRLDPNGRSADILLAYLNAIVLGTAALPTPAEDTQSLLPVPPPAPSIEIMVDGKIHLSKLWPLWLAVLTEPQQRIILAYYGVEDETPLTLEEIGNEQGMTRERVRQIKSKGLNLLHSRIPWSLQESVHKLLSTAVAQADGLLTIKEWRQVLDEETIWEGDEARPSLMRLLCELFGEFTYNKEYHVVCAPAISERLNLYHTILKRILRKHKEGLAEDRLLAEIERALPQESPAAMREAAFLTKGLSLFDRLERGADERYYYRRVKKAALLPTPESLWLGRPGTQLYQREKTLRQQLENVSWIGQLALREEEFNELCALIQSEAQAPNYFTKEIQGQPRLVPAAVFITTMVFAARYSQQEADEFWVPYLKTVWNVPYTQAFMVRCAKRFNLAIAELEQACQLEFPRGATGGVVAPIYRHALLPSYVQNDFANWMRDKWREILPLADFPLSLVAKLQEDSSLDYLPRRLQTFILGKETNETAAALIADMAAALSLYVNGGQSSENIRQQLADTPIKQELWDEIAEGIMQELAREHERAQSRSRVREQVTSSEPTDAETLAPEIVLPPDEKIKEAIARVQGNLFPSEVAPAPELESNQPSTAILSPTRLRPPRVDWVWIVDEGEMGLRVQNIILPPNGELEGEAVRLVWLESAEHDPTLAEIAVDVRPWLMQTGEQVIQEELMTGVDGHRQGQIILLTDEDEMAVRIDVPPLPTRPVQFFRLIQQGAYGLPVDPLQVDSGDWLICAAQPLTFCDDDNEIIQPDGIFPVPYPLHNHYQWAAQLSLTLPVTVKQGSKKLLELTTRGTQASIAPPRLQGEAPIGGLSPRLQPTFSNTKISVTITYGGKWLARRAAVWLYGQDGWRWIHPLASILASGEAVLNNDTLDLDLSSILPARPNVYALELRAGLQSLLASPVAFAVLPGVQVTYPAAMPLYTPATPFQILLEGVEEANILPDGSMSITSVEDSLQLVAPLQITWHDLRHEPRLRLQWSDIEIPLTWSIARFTAWLEPQPAQPFLTLDELGQTTIHVVGKQMESEQFTLSVSNKGTNLSKRDFALKRGQSSIQLAQSQLYDMIRAVSTTHLQVDIEAGGVTWPLFDVRQRPKLSTLTLQVDEQASILHIRTGLQKEWVGQIRFYVESVTNPFASGVTMGSGDRLLSEHHVSLLPLADDTYRLRLELDGVLLPLNEQATIFTIGKSEEEQPEDPELAELIRSGKLIPEHYTNDFVLWWAEIAEAGKTEISQSTRYQFASIHARDLLYFDYPHLKKLWPALADLRAVRDKQRWFKEHGLFPIWVLQPGQARYPSAASYLPEPKLPEKGTTIVRTRWQQLATLTKVVNWHGSNERISPWAGAARLLNHWKDNDASELGRGSFALGMLLRTAAYYPQRYTRLLKEAALTEADVQELLALINLHSADHLQWGLTWAELLFVHSLRYSVR